VRERERREREEREERREKRERERFGVCGGAGRPQRTL
jgi:hypothetical protein